MLIKIAIAIIKGERNRIIRKGSPLPCLNEIVQRHGVEILFNHAKLFPENIDIQPVNAIAAIYTVIH